MDKFASTPSYDIRDIPPFKYPESSETSSEDSSNESQDEFTKGFDPFAEVMQREMTFPNSPTPLNACPDMVPISVRSDLDNFKEVTIERVLCGIDLTWEEFFHLFHIYLDPKLHIIKGTNARSAQISDKIGDYVSTLKRKLNNYLINVEIKRVEPLKKRLLKRGTQWTTKTARIGLKRKIRRPKWTEMDMQIDESEIPSSKRKMSGKISSKSSEAASPPKLTKETKISEPNISTAEVKKENEIAQIDPKLKVKPINNKRDSTDSNDSENKKVKKIDNSIETQNGIKPQKIEPNPPEEKKLNVSVQKEKTDEVSDEEEDLKFTTNNQPKVNSPAFTGDTDTFKNSVINFLVNKISNRNMLRIRDELLSVKRNDDYFKLTSVAPISSGLLEQMFCRNIN